MWTTFFFIFVHVMWRVVRRSVCEFNQHRWSSLTREGTWCNMIGCQLDLWTCDKSWPFIARVITVEIKSDWWTLLDAWGHLKCSMKIKLSTLHVVFVDVRRGKIWVLYFPLDGHDLIISSEPLTENQLPYRTIMPNFAYLYTPSMV